MRGLYSVKQCKHNNSVHSGLNIFKNLNVELVDVHLDSMLYHEDCLACFDLLLELNCCVFSAVYSEPQPL